MKGRRCVGDAVQHHPLRRAKVVHKSLVETTCQGRFWFNIEGRFPPVSDGDTTTVAIDIATGSVNGNRRSGPVHVAFLPNIG